MRDSAKHGPHAGSGKKEIPPPAPPHLTLLPHFFRPSPKPFRPDVAMSRIESSWDQTLVNSALNHRIRFVLARRVQSLSSARLLDFFSHLNNLSKWYTSHGSTRQHQQRSAAGDSLKSIWPRGLQIVLIIGVVMGRKRIKVCLRRSRWLLLLLFLGRGEGRECELWG